MSDAWAGRNRTVAAVFVDITDSTGWLGKLGRAPYAELIEDYRRLAQSAAGREVGLIRDTPGDGLFATFDACSDAVAFAVSLTTDIRLHPRLGLLGIQVTTAIHAGEILEATSPIGLAIHTAARVGAIVPPGAVIVTRTVERLLAEADAASYSFH